MVRPDDTVDPQDLVVEVPLPHAAAPDRTPHLLLRRPFLWLVLGDGWAQLGRWAFFLAVVGDATYRLEASASQVGLLIGLFSVPLILASPFYGAIADAGSAKWLLVVTSVGSLPVPFIALNTDSIRWLYAAAILYGVVHAALMPSRGALVPRLVAREQLVQANGMISAAASVQMVIGPAIGAILVATGGSRAPYFVTLAAAPLAALSYLLLPDRRRAAASAGHSPFAQVGAGFLEAWRSRALRTLLGLDVGVWFLIGLLLALEPSYVKSDLGLSQTFLAILWSVYGAGELIGSILLARHRSDAAGRELVLASRGLLLAAIGFLLYASIPIGVVALVANVIFGVGFPFFVASSSALIQRVARHPGKVTAAFSMVGEAGPVLSAVTLAVAGAAVDVRPWLIGSGAVFALVAVAASRIAPRLPVGSDA